MRKVVLSMIGASALAIGSLTATAANAAVNVIAPPDTVIHPAKGQTMTFFVSGDIFSGPIAATFGDVGIPKGDFTDIFKFTIPQTGTGSGSLTTTVDIGGFGGSTDLDIISVLVNGLAASPVYRDLNGLVCTTPGVGSCGATETFAINDVPIVAGVLNTITINGTSRGLGSYGGNATFLPAVPEPSTWALMILGFGAAGFAMRRTRKADMRLAQAA